jgi:hypothetical protein
MIDNANHIAWAAEAVEVFQKHCGTGDEHAIADLICDLGHLAEDRGFDFLSEIRRGIGHWYAEHHASDRDHLGRCGRNHHHAKIALTLLNLQPVRFDGNQRRSDSSESTDALCPLAATHLAARGRKRIQGAS